MLGTVLATSHTSSYYFIQSSHPITQILLFPYAIFTDCRLQRIKKNKEIQFKFIEFNYIPCPILEVFICYRIGEKVELVDQQILSHSIEEY